MSVIAVILLVPAAAGTVFYLLSTVATLRFCARTRGAAPAGHPPVTVLKAFRGCDPGFAESLDTFAKMGGGEAQVLFGCATQDDPGLPIARAFCERHADARAEVVTERPGVNEKVNNLIGIAPQAKHGLLLLSDSDVRVSADFACRALAAFADPKVGLVSCPYRSRGIRSLAGLLEAAWIGLDFIPSVFLAAMLGPVRFALGAAIALRGEALAQIGGFRAVQDHVADDYQLGYQIAGMGWKVQLAPVFVDLWGGPTGLLEFFLRQLRWARTIRVSNPLGHLFSILAKPIPFALLALGAAPRSPMVLLAAACVIGTRMITSFINSLAQRCDARVILSSLISPITELLSTLIWLLSFGGRSVVWRGVRYNVLGDGRIARIP